MNERIKELATEVGISVDYKPLRIVLIEKFAELIVQECIQVLKDTGYPNAHGNCVGVEEIKQHFGVDLK